jgi:hypothetical protein
LDLPTRDLGVTDIIKSDRGQTKIKDGSRFALTMLRLEFLSAGSPDCPLLRISGDDVQAASRLRKTFTSLAHGSTKEACINELPDIQAIDGVKLTAFVGKTNRGVVRVGDSRSFHWFLTSAGWANNADLIEAFCESVGVAYFQWLDSPSDISVLFSPSGYC